TNTKAPRQPEPTDTAVASTNTPVPPAPTNTPVPPAPPVATDTPRPQPTNTPVVPPTNTPVLDVIAIPATPVPPATEPPAPSATPTRLAEAQPNVPKLPRTGDEDYAVVYYLLGVMGSLALAVAGTAVWRTARRRPEDEYTLKLK
ncbi:MAG: hypothetical protein M3390_11840, partial [Chloroflexota bacterium]|nr:hypothetical protein [Chloroflexota bacterium]